MLRVTSMVAQYLAESKPMSTAAGVAKAKERNWRSQSQ